MFRNPQDKQIPKLPLGFQFDHDLIEKTRKHLVAFLTISTVVCKDWSVSCHLSFDFSPDENIGTGLFNVAFLQGLLALSSQIKVQQNIGILE